MNIREVIPIVRTKMSSVETSVIASASVDEPKNVDVDEPKNVDVDENKWYQYFIDRLPTDGYAYMDPYNEGEDHFGISVFTIAYDLYKQVQKIDPHSITVPNNLYHLQCCFPPKNVIMYYSNEAYEIHKEFNSLCKGITDCKVDDTNKTLVEALYAILLEHPVFLYLYPNVKDAAYKKACELMDTPIAWNRTLADFGLMCNHLETDLAWYYKTPTLKPTVLNVRAVKNALIPSTKVVGVVPPDPYVLDDDTQRSVEHFVKNFATLNKCKVYTVYNKRQARKPTLLKTVLVHEGVLLEIPPSYIMASTLGRNCGPHNYPIEMYILTHAGYPPVYIESDFLSDDSHCGGVTIRQGKVVHKIRLH